MVVPLDIPGIDMYVEDHADGAVLRNPTRDHVIQGLLIALLLPVAVILLALLFLLMAGATSDQTTVWIVIGGLAGAGCLISLVSGLVMVATAGRKSRRSRVLLHARHREIRAPGEHPVPWSGITRVRLHKPNPLLKWWGISAELEGGGSALLLGKLPPSRGREIAGVARFIAVTVGVDAEIPDAVERAGGLSLGVSRNTAGFLCYLPFQGIFLIASLWYALTSRDPFIRFCAKQSLAQFALSMALLALLLGCGGGFVALTSSSMPAGVHVALLVALLTPYILWRVVARIMACFHAWNGRPWVMPWLAPVARRWLPELDAGVAENGESAT